MAGTTRARIDLDAESVTFARRHPELFGGAPTEPPASKVGRGVAERAAGASGRPAAQALVAARAAANPLLDPRICQRMVDEFHRARGVDWSYGGYLEDRRHLWRDSYLSALGGYLHLGCDLNVPQGTRVAVVEDALVMLVDDDQDADGGWGIRVLVKPTSPRRARIVQIYAHLQAVRVHPGDRLVAGSVFAEVGGPPHNGNWHPHLHVQAIREAHFQEVLLERFREMDGYGHQDDLAKLRRDFPDPLLRFPEFARREPGTARSRFRSAPA